MADNRSCPSVGGSVGREVICIDTNRVLDGYRDKDASKM